MLLKSLKKYIFQLFIEEKLVYHAGKPMSVADSNSFTEATNLRPWAIVVGREHYLEWVKRYPVGDASELMSILKKQQSRDYLAIYQIGPLQNRHRTVQCWQVEQNLLELYPSAVFWLPESLLLKPLFSEYPVLLIQSPSSSYFATMQEEHLISAPKSSVLSCSELFCSSNGLPLIEARTVDLTATLLKHSILQLGLADLWRSFRFRLSEAFRGELLILSQVLVAVFFSYQILASLYLLSSTPGLFGKDIRQLQQVEQMLKVQNQLQQDTALLAVQQDVLSSKNYSYPVWLLMAELLKQEVELTNVQYNDSKIVVRGQATSATQVLTFLKQHALVQYAEFESAVRRQGENETFVVLVQLKTEGV